MHRDLVRVAGDGMKLRNPAMSPAEATVLIEQGYLESDGVTPTAWVNDPDDFDPITEQLIEDFA